MTCAEVTDLLDCEALVGGPHRRLNPDTPEGRLTLEQLECLRDGVTVGVVPASHVVQRAKEFGINLIGILQFVARS